MSDITTVEVASLDAVPEGLRALFAEKDGKFVAQIAPKAKLDEFRNTNIERGKENDTLKQQLADAKKAEAELQKLRDEMAAGKVGVTNDAVEKLLEERYGRALNDKEAAIKARDEKLAEEQRERERIGELLRQRAIDSEVSIQASDLGGFHPQAIEDARMYARQVFQLDENGEPVARDSNGSVRFGSDGKTPLSIKEWLAGTKTSKPHWWKAVANGSGGNGNGAGGSAVDPNLSPVERLNRAWSGGRAK